MSRKTLQNEAGNRVHFPSGVLTPDGERCLVKNRTPMGGNIGIGNTGSNPVGSVGAGVRPVFRGVLR